MLFEDGPVRLCVKAGADIADHVAGGITGHRIQNFSIRRVRQIVQQPHGVAVQQLVNGFTVDIGLSFELGSAQDD